jgi:N-acetylneuraminic acid mutarotase
MNTKRDSLNARILPVASRNGLWRQRKRVTAAGLVLGGLCLYLAWAANAAPGSWTQKQDIPAPTETCASCALDGIFYVIGGHYPDSNTALDTVWAYDPQADRWTNRAPLPTPRHWLGQCAVAVDGIIYVVGGSGSGTPGPLVLPVAAYNPRTDQWTNGANIPTGRGNLAACAVDGIIYAIGGYLDGTHTTAAVEAYDPKSDQWTTKGNTPYRSFFLAASVAPDGLAYLFGYTLTWAYDPKTDSWNTNKSHFYPYSWALRAAEVGGLIYLFGGFNQDWTGANDVTWAYDPAQDQFTARRHMPLGRGGAACGVIGGKVYLTGGTSKPSTRPDPVYYTALDVFDPQGGVSPQIQKVAWEIPDYSVRLTWQGDVGVSYGVESRPKVASGSWTRMMFTTGTDTVQATDALVEASCLVPPGDTNRFFRVLETH